MSSHRLKGHGLFLMRRLHGVRQVVERAIERQDSSHRPLADMNAQLLEGSMHPKLAQSRILLEPAHRRDNFEIHFTPTGAACPRLVG